MLYQDSLNRLRIPYTHFLLLGAEPSRTYQTREERNFKCYHLATELRKRNMMRVDYMTLDTEGSELDIIEDFPWTEFDIRVVQVEQLTEDKFPSQKGRKERIIRHMTGPKGGGYLHLGAFAVADDTDDLIFVRNSLDTVLEMTDYLRGKHPEVEDTIAFR